MLRSPLLSLAALGPLAVLSHQSSVEITPQTSGTTNRLQAISAVSDRVVWASGVGGTYVLTTDGGHTWRPGVVPGAERLEFRDIEAVSDKKAYLLAAGTGEDSRIYRTEDGGKHWTMQFMNDDLKAFYDCFAFWEHQRGVTMSDAVDGVFPVIRTTDGEHWKHISSALPAAQSSEGAFAASGTCVATQGRGNAWIATGGGATARILATADGGDSWTAHDTPIVRGASGAGGVSVAFRDRLHGILGGGDLAVTEAFTDNVARSGDGGKTWQLASHPTFTGAIYGLAYVPRLKKTVVATGPRGASWTSDEGSHWFALDTVTNYWAVGFSSPDAGWLVGTGGRIAKLRFRKGG